MYADVKIKFKGLKEFLKTDMGFNEKINLQIAEDILHFHYALDKRAHAVYNMPASLSTVLHGKTVRREKLSKTFANFGLQYKYRPVKLEKFPFVVSKNLFAISYAPVRTLDDRIALIKGKFSYDVRVAVKKGRFATVSRYGNPIYERKHRKGLRVRKQEATWNEFPSKYSEGDRENTTSGVFGPSLAQIALNMLTYDAQTKKNLTQLQHKLFNHYYNTLLR